MRWSPFACGYDQTPDRESAFELLAAKEAEREERRGRGGRQSIGEAMLKSVVRSMSSSVGRSLGRQILRGLLGGVRR